MNGFPDEVAPQHQAIMDLLWVFVLATLKGRGWIKLWDLFQACRLLILVLALPQTKVGDILFIKTHAQLNSKPPKRYYRIKGCMGHVFTYCLVGLSSTLKAGVLLSS